MAARRDATTGGGEQNRTPTIDKSRRHSLLDLKVFGTNFENNVVLHIKMKLKFAQLHPLISGKSQGVKRNCGKCVTEEEQEKEWYPATRDGQWETGGVATAAERSGK